MIHLQGAWGDGKSTFLRLLRGHLLKFGARWIVVDFNAWQNQHINPPWWILMSQTYTQAASQLPFYLRPYLFVREWWRRILGYRTFSKIVTFALVLGFGSLLFYSRNFIFGMGTSFIESAPSESNKEMTWIVFVKIVVGLGSVGGLLYSLSKFLSHSFFLSNPEDAKSFMQEAADPMQRVRVHFERMIADLKLLGYNTAIFIDDIDRCNASYTVSLLEGIQTLFKDSPVLYVVAGDRHWICTCFETHYEKYRDVAREPAQKLGYLFIEKAFQLSFRLPEVSNAAKKKYWNYILSLQKPGYDAETENTTVDKRFENFKHELKAKVRNTVGKTDLSNPDKLGQISSELNLSDEQVTDIALELMDENQDDIRHLLVNHHDLIDTNPRGIKRLANQYTVYRNILTAERKPFDRDKLFRWLILQNKYPVFTDWLEKNLNAFATTTLLHEDLSSLIDDKKWKALMFDEVERHGGPITADDITTFTGISVISHGPR